MRVEFEFLGKDVNFVAVNKADAVSTQEKLVEACSFPLLQDLDDVNVWGLMSGNKDDFYVFDAAGNLSAYLPIGGEIEMNLDTAEGYDNLKNAVLDALSAQ